MADISHLIEPTFFHHLPEETQLNLNFFIIGAGGTGGYLIPNLVRQVALSNQLRKKQDALLHTITVIDGDDLESKNLIRQNFVMADIGKNKAEVMAQRYGRAFQQNVNYVKEYLSTPARFEELINNTLDGNRPIAKQHVVIIDCTDNNKTRLMMKSTVADTNYNAVLLSSGNEEFAGQVVCSFRPRQPRRIDWDKNHSLQNHVWDIQTPDFFEMFPNTPIDKMPGELSCAEASVSSPQNIYTNMTAANILFGFVNKLLAGQGISELAVFFDTTTAGQRVYRSKISDYKALLTLTPSNGSQSLYLFPRDVVMKSGVSASTPISWSEVMEQDAINKAKATKQAQELLDAAIAAK